MADLFLLLFLFFILWGLATDTCCRDGIPRGWFPTSETLCSTANMSSAAWYRSRGFAPGWINICFSKVLQRGEGWQPLMVRDCSGNRAGIRNHGFSLLFLLPHLLLHLQANVPWGGSSSLVCTLLLADLQALCSWHAPSVCRGEDGY